MMIWGVLATVTLAQAQTTRPPDVEPVHAIDADQTWIVLRDFSLDALSGLSHLQRRPVEEILREFWRWETGRMSVAGATIPNAKIGEGRNDPQGLNEQLALWRRLAEIELQFTDSEIRQGSNALGGYFFIVSDQTNADLVCVYFRQGLPVRNANGNILDSDDVAGEISGYDCRDSTSTTPAAMEQTVTSMLNAIAFR